MFRTKSVIVRDVSDSMASEALRSDPDNPAVDMPKAREQHKKYVSFFREKLELKVIHLEQDPTLPDCVFVEDPLVVIENKALLTTLGHDSRRPERKVMQSAVEKIPQLEVHVMEDIDPEARLDGGDVLYTGQEILVGKSSRTNDAGIKALSQVFSGMKVTSIAVSDTLHLKSVCTLACPSTIIVATGDNSAREVVERVKSSATGKYQFLEVDGKACGANCVYLETSKGTVLIHPPSSVYPDIAQAYESIKADIKVAMDTSEFAKVDGCLTCMSVLLSV